MEKQPRKGRPIFGKILFSVGALILLEAAVLIGVIFGGGTLDRLNQNAEDILYERVLSRRNYLENEMLKWSSFSLTAQQITQKAEQMLENGDMTLEELCKSSSGAAPLLIEASEDLIELMRSNRVNGAFLMLSSEEPQEGQSRPGLYLRDMDPLSAPSLYNQDLLIERGPVEAVQQLGISTDLGWDSRFMLEGEEGEFLLPPLREAFREKHWEMEDLGYWHGPHTLSGDSERVFTYAVPLALGDGRVYGVLGIEITESYLKKIVPYSELMEDKKGSYLLAVEEDGEPFRVLWVNGSTASQAERAQKVRLSEDRRGRMKIETDVESFSCSVQQLSLYTRNTPFFGQRWMLIGAVREQDLYAFSNKIGGLLITAIVLMLLAGAVGCLIIGKGLSRPIVALAEDLGRSGPLKARKLRRTRIAEVDLLASAIENLSRDVMESSEKFGRIMKMASVRIAGFEIERSTQKLFITDNFFELFGITEVNAGALTIADFEEILNGLEQYRGDFDSETSEGMAEALYRVPSQPEPVYIRMRYLDDGSRRLGLAEDVTRTVCEQERIKHERDHDLLTGLSNRRAFYRAVGKLFERGRERLQTAAMVMMDMDNLKRINDTFGHSWGDKYILAAAQCFTQNCPEKTLISRIAGDEFLLFFYGYSNKEQLREALEHLKQGIRSSILSLPNGEDTQVQMSGGVAWYPDDSDSYEELARFADFAMYKVKQNTKGQLEDFDLEVYKREAHLLQNREELTQLLEQAKVIYYFQPVVSAASGEIVAYEALMRTDLPNLRTPEEILTLAKFEGKLDQVEELTVFETARVYREHVESGRMAKECKLFVKSISNHILSEKKQRQFEQLYAGYLDKLIFEVTEGERGGEGVVRSKKATAERWGSALALDNYGSDYNSERVLHYLSPEFVKVDLAVVQGIDQDPDKQRVVERIVDYGRKHGVLILAEGIETEGEAETVIRIGVDYVQGSLFASPAQIPPEVSQEGLNLIRNLREKRRQEGQI